MKMAKKIDPKQTKRAMAFELWMDAPNPMVTFFKTLDVTPLIKMSRRKKLKFNMLLDYCIGKAASCVKEFYILPVGHELVQYDSIAVNTIVKNKEGEVSSCDILFTEDLAKFNQDYLRYTMQVADSLSLIHSSGARISNRQIRNFTPMALLYISSRGKFTKTEPRSI